MRGLGRILLGLMLTIGGLTPAAVASADVADDACGTWVLQQVTSRGQLASLRPRIERALEVDGVTGFSIRVPWTLIDRDLGVLDDARALASAAGKRLSIRFMAGAHTPEHVFTAGSPYYMSGGKKVPTPFTSSGGVNAPFEAAYRDLVERLAGWSRANDVRLLHLSWYGQDWAELNHGKEVRARPGYSQAAWLRAHERLVDIGASVASADLAVELPLSGYGPVAHNGLAAALAQRVIDRVGPSSPRFFVQANGWSPSGEWGAPDASTEAAFDEVWDLPVRRGLQAIQPQDYDWSAAYARLRAVGATYAEVYLPSFEGARAAELRREAAAFASRCAGAGGGAVERLGGSDRVGTAVAISRGTHATATTVVLARSDAYADALAGAPLAAHVGGPLLLSASDRLSAAVRDEVRRLRASQAILLGGTAALSSQVASDLRDLGLSVRRIQGGDRFATAAAIAAELPRKAEVLIAEGASADQGRGWPDALSAAGLGASTGLPVLLVTRDVLPPSTAAALAGRSTATIVGGTASVGADVAAAIDRRVGTVRRLHGTDRYATSAAVAGDAVRRGVDPATVWVATGRAFPDGLAAAAAAGADRGVLVLVDGREPGGAAASYRFLRDHAGTVTMVRIAGGQTAISNAVETALHDAVS